jgi:hypothetical protein
MAIDAARPNCGYAYACLRTYKIDRSWRCKRLWTIARTKTGVYILAGHIATEGVWAAFSKEWEGMLRLGTPRHSNDRSIKAGINVEGGKSVPPFNASFTLATWLRIVSNAASSKMKSYAIFGVVHRVALVPQQSPKRTGTGTRVGFDQKLS